MTEQDKLQFLVDLDDRLLLGGVIISEKAAFLIRESDVAFVNGASLASIITALAGIEAYLRSESDCNKSRLVELINYSDLADDLKREIHALRKYRNTWVHIADPWDDASLLNSPELHEMELEQMAIRSAIALRLAIYSGPWI